MRDSRYEAITDSPTASPMGRNRNRAGPSRNTTDTNTMPIDSEATNAGRAICWAPSRMARVSVLPMARWRWMFSISTVASSTRMPTDSASPPRVMAFRLWPSARSTSRAATTDSGMDTATIRVLRQLPRNSRIIAAVRQAAISPSTSSPWMAASTKLDWSDRIFTSSPSGADALIVGSSARIRLATSMVEASPVFITDSTTERRPFSRARLVCTANPSCTWPTSRT